MRGFLGVRVTGFGPLFEDPAGRAGLAQGADEGKVADDGDFLPLAKREQKILPGRVVLDIWCWQQGIDGGHGQGRPVGIGGGRVQKPLGDLMRALAGTFGGFVRGDQRGNVGNQGGQTGTVGPHGGQTHPPGDGFDAVVRCGRGVPYHGFEDGLLGKRRTHGDAPVADGGAVSKGAGAREGNGESRAGRRSGWRG